MIMDTHMKQEDRDSSLFAYNWNYGHVEHS